MTSVTLNCPTHEREPGLLICTGAFPKDCPRYKIEACKPSLANRVSWVSHTSACIGRQVAYALEILKEHAPCGSEAARAACRRGGGEVRESVAGPSRRPVDPAVIEEAVIVCGVAGFEK